MKQAPQNSQGAAVLAPGRWFVDMQETRWLGGACIIAAKYFGRSGIGDFVGSGGRGQIMVELDNPLFEVVIPREEYVQLGPIYEMPDGQDLKGTSDLLYGPAMREPMSTLEWMQTVNPEAFQKLVEITETVANTAKAAAKAVTSGASTGLWLVGLGLVGFAAYKAFK